MIEYKDGKYLLHVTLTAETPEEAIHALLRAERPWLDDWTSVSFNQDASTLTIRQVLSSRDLCSLVTFFQERGLVVCQMEWKPQMCSITLCWPPDTVPF